MDPREKIIAERGEPPEQEYYPQFVGDDLESRKRWDYCVAGAIFHMQEPLGSPSVHQMARTLYSSDIPTFPT